MLGWVYGVGWYCLLHIRGIIVNVSFKYLKGYLLTIERDMHGNFLDDLQIVGKSVECNWITVRAIAMMLLLLYLDLTHGPHLEVRHVSLTVYISVTQPARSTRSP